MSKALIPGSFDPFTKGHLEIVKKASVLFDEIVVLVAKNSSKNYLFDTSTRALLIKDAVKDLHNVTVDCFDGLLVNYANKNNCDVTVKGIRNFTDYEYENSMALTNNKLSKSIYGSGITTLFIPCSPEYSDVSSSLVRLLLFQNGDISSLVPNESLILEYFNKK